MPSYIDIARSAWTNYANYLLGELTHPHPTNWVWWLIGVSLFFACAEWLRPWRADQPKFRQGFWLDAFYMFFNFFLFSLLIYAALSDVAVAALDRGFEALGLSYRAQIPLQWLPWWAQLGVAFVVRDFVQWNVHRLLHRVPALWEFHKVHHSVQQMGFAANLRFHWVETIVYRTLEYIPLALLGFGLDDFFVVHLVGLIIGHANHANIRLPLGPLRYVFNSPQMHIWHHVKRLPPGKKFQHGINYGICLSAWDYLFGTACIPHDGRDIELGFDGDETFPTGFVGQETWGFGARRGDEAT